MGKTLFGAILWVYCQYIATQVSKQTRRKDGWGCMYCGLGHLCLGLKEYKYKCGHKHKYKCGHKYKSGCIAGWDINANLTPAQVSNQLESLETIIRVIIIIPTTNPTMTITNPTMTITNPTAIIISNPSRLTTDLR